ncbi:UvrD-helicase domain-containing protein [Rothia uropygialis]|uniref:UvrD-helicase domain-containing protein n=1 Tax=Kocuria sp. 36 TaxID=1415402 RepID=UPI00101D37CE|nr:UvrD-helicase domain-containing protein [Kocuria sp. 36]
MPSSGNMSLVFVRKAGHATVNRIEYPDRIRYSPEDIATALGHNLPTEEQSKIISADLSPRLVVAGAGSGKTATMVDRVVWLVVNGLVRPDEILGVTFTKKAAGELRHRMAQRLVALREEGLYQPEADSDEPVLDPTVSTYHAYAKSLVSEYGLRIGVEKDATQLGQAQCFQLVAQIVENWDGELPEKIPAASTLITEVLQLSGECAEHLRTPEEVEDFCRRSLSSLKNMPNNHPKKLKKEEKLRGTLVEKLEQKLLVARLTERYRRIKQAMQVMDFGDLLAYAATMARGIDCMGSEQRQLYRVVLLDEFQDTSHAQMVLFSSLFGNGHSVMAVGDPKQSIYGFRGASEGQLFDFYRYFPSPHQDADYLSVAWRNGTRILDAANRIARPLSAQGEWVRAASPVHVPDLVARPEAPEGRLMTGIWGTDQDEAEAIVSTIAAHRSDADLEGREVPSSAVLCRTRRHMETIRLECERQSVPYQLVGLGGLVETPEVTDLVAVLRVLSDPARSDSLMRLLAGARWRIGPRDLMALNDWARFLARRRKRSVLTGMAEDLATPEGRIPGEEHLVPADPQSELHEASQRLEDLLRTGGDQSESSSLIEAIETLPEAGWTSAAGRSLSAEARQRLVRLQQELEELRGYLGEDLTSLLYHIERVTMLDLELASKPGRDVHQARANVDAFYQAVADYCAAAPRLAASLDAGSSFSGASGTEGLEITELKEHRYTVTSSATGVTAFLAWLEATIAEESGLSMPVQPSESSAVQILTVHAAKGLEWDEVYVQGLTEGGFPSDKTESWFSDVGALPWALRGDTKYLPALNLGVGSTQELEESGQEFSQHNLARIVSEERRLAYVATTRARNVLFLASSHWSGTKAKPNSLSRFVEEISEEFDPTSPAIEWVNEAPVPEEGTKNPQGERIYAALWPFDPLTRPFVSEWGSEEELNDLAMAEDHGAAELDPGPVVSRRVDVERAASLVLSHMHTDSGTDSMGPAPDASLSLPSNELPDPTDWAEETSLLLALHRARADSGGSPELPTHLSASLLVGLAQDPERILEQIRRPMPRRPETSARAGTRFHEWVEEHYGAAGMLDLGEGLADPEEGDGAGLAALQESFRTSPWFDRQPWAIEYPIETPLAGFTVRGRIDAIFRNENATGKVQWELVDWKTGRVPRGADLTHKTVQLAVYKMGFARLHDVDPEDISAAFYYVAHAKTIRPRKVADETELIDLVKRMQNTAPGTK